MESCGPVVGWYLYAYIVVPYEIANTPMENVQIEIYQLVDSIHNTGQREFQRSVVFIDINGQYLFPCFYFNKERNWDHIDEYIIK